MSDNLARRSVFIEVSDGAAFGELALLSEDCIRTASIVADEPTDLVVIHRDLYNRSVARVIKKEYEEKYNVVDTNPIFREWAQKWKRHLAIAMTKIVYNYGDVIYKQGDNANRLYFILSGETKLIVDPEPQYEQFKDFMEQNISLCQDARDIFRKEKQDPARRVRKLLEEKQKEDITNSALDSQTLTPSVIRKQLLFHRQHAEKINLCYLREGQLLGDVEFLLNLPKYHTTACCTHETEVLWIHKAHFERLFRKRNPSCLKIMAQLILTSVNTRLSREGLVRKMPFFKCLQLKLTDLTEDKVKVKEDPSNLPEVNMDNMLIKQRSISQMDHKLPDPPPNYRRLHRSQTARDAYSFKSPTPTTLSSLNNFLPGGSLGAGFNTGAASMGTGLGAGAATSDSQTEVVIVDKPLLNPRDGIFVKLMQVSNPDISPDRLSVDEEEFEYLIKLRRRIAREFQDFSMGKKVPFSEGLEGIIERPCRTSKKVTTQKLVKRMFPMLLGGQGRGGHGHAMSAGHVRSDIRLPNF